jgi:hypothetical protein
MERFNALGRGMQLMLVGGVLLFIDLFLPWQGLSGNAKDAAEALGIDTSVSAFHGFGGWLLALLTLVLLAWIVARLAAVEIPIPVSTAMTAGVLAFLIFAVALLKALVDNDSVWGSWVGVILALVVAVGAWMQIQESGGLETLKSELPSMPAASAPAAETPAPPAPPEPESMAAPAPPAPESMAAPPPPPEPEPPAETETSSAEPPSEPEDEGEQTT